ncbi:flavodoxin family protein [Flavivirga eckloniae]|uniref:FMN reductase n=1 Tax=Flavivirga eckloniae TaxID=1803846 RepID=A0A2K9PVE0_9FLAO|nr:NAD(P)H-dependent oxidoreductase [Flavivirga eckloniae]AUP81033.1 FMN reductase [Flavivirga eckloniae]
MERSVIIQGSSRSQGDTNKIVNYLATKTNSDVIDLYTKNIGHYDYDYKNEGDDFLGLITHIIENYDTIIFATPVYWYSMSGILKVFFDRISDLIRIHKTTGRKLRGKKMAMISCSNHDDLKNGFSMPFKASANYLGMHYLGDIHTYVESNTVNREVKIRIDDFVKTLNQYK